MSLRDQVLSALKDNQNDWISGERLSETLQVSRTTIWKYIKTLETEGYVIESSPKKGYKLSSPPDLLAPDEVCPGLKSKVFGQQHYFYFREIDSTNNQARNLASEGYPEGTVVVAETQTAGRGRRGRSWYSPDSQGIYVSLILRPILPMKEISRISLLSAVVVAETLQNELSIPARIKWPNDILVNQKKICGILSEAVTDTDGIEYIVIGIGINMNNQVQEFPGDFRTAATSARTESTRDCSRIKVLQGLLANFERRYFNLLEGRFDETLEKGRVLSLAIGSKLRLDTINGSVEGQAIDIDDNGFLLLRDQSGVIHTVMSGEISII